MDFKGIDKTSPVPYYYQLEQLLREKIERQSFVPPLKLVEQLCVRL